MKQLIFILFFTIGSACFAQTLTIESAVARIPIAQYPSLARYFNLRGDVRLLVTVSEGQLCKVTAGESDKVLANVAIDFVKQIEFKANATGILILDFKFILTEKPAPDKPWQRFGIDPESNTITLEASRKVVTDSDFFNETRIGA